MRNYIVSLFPLCGILKSQLLTGLVNHTLHKYIDKYLIYLQLKKNQRCPKEENYSFSIFICTEQVSCLDDFFLRRSSFWKPCEKPHNISLNILNPVPCPCFKSNVTGTASSSKHHLFLFSTINVNVLFVLYFLFRNSVINSKRMCSK